MENELLSQRDGFWPCRGQILHHRDPALHHLLIHSDRARRYKLCRPGRFFPRYPDYLNEHINDQITLEILTKQFAVNRNKLNDLFMKQSSMTCLNYPLNLRMDLAKVLLTKTELPISEISARVGFPDPNCFAQIFRRETA